MAAERNGAAEHMSLVKGAFRGPEAAKIVGITYRQLDHWARKDLVTPSLAAAHGSGTQRCYSYEDLLELKVVKSLRDAGVSLSRIETAFDYIREHLSARAAELRIFSDGTNVYGCRSKDEVISLLDRGQVVFGFALEKMYEDLDGAIAHFSPSPYLPGEEADLDNAFPDKQTAREAGERRAADG